jgi:hypothetical protein
VPAVHEWADHRRRRQSPKIALVFKVSKFLQSDAPHRLVSMLARERLAR